jgi:hypothetical protein
MRYITGELLFNAVLPCLQKGIEISCSMLCWHVSECWLHLVMVMGSSIYLRPGVVRVTIPTFIFLLYLSGGHSSHNLSGSRVMVTTGVGGY